MAYTLYVQDILMPEEQILHHSKVHYILYFPGVFMILAAIGLTYCMPGFLTFLQISPVDQGSWFSVAKFIAVTLFLAGVVMILKAWVKIYSTELVVTDKRVLVKVGISTAITAEIDRSRISSVVVRKPLLGRILDYGWIGIYGYSGDITGLPVLASPHEIQRHIYAKHATKEEEQKVAT